MEYINGSLRRSYLRTKLITHAGITDGPSKKMTREVSHHTYEGTKVPSNEGTRLRYY